MPSCPAVTGRKLLASKWEAHHRELYLVCDILPEPSHGRSVTVINRSGRPRNQPRLCPMCGATSLTVPVAERSKSLDSGSELEITQVQILSVTTALFISTIDLVLYGLSPLFCLIRSSHRPVAHEGGQNKA
ncbi:hypothetical protein J6590_072173 [Homalodisca vitripennis]|nr:hypothetical protein J6590_072173 [Homalodisca vitripennis]